ncbi:unnamed protein product, partial [Ectocarpus sp. 12 AP-2014]
ANAATFSGTFDGSWYDSDYFGGSGNSIDDTGNNADWGNRRDDERSQLTFMDGNFSHELQGGHNLYEIGRIEWYNASWNNFDPFFRLEARLELDIDAPISDQNNVDYIDLDIDTSNNGSSVAEDAAMLVSFDDFFIGLPLNFGDGYFLEGFEVSVAGDGGLSGLNWTNPEQGTSELILSAKISGPAVVPLPAAGWMLLAGLGGLAAMKRRRKS